MKKYLIMALVAAAVVYASNRVAPAAKLIGKVG